MAAKKPRNIQKLDEVVVNRIAAGEVIQRPANALKELMENSLDAGSTSIQVTVRDGGLKLLKIQDNGTGINKEDFELVCQRFTTSKLDKFDDLSSIGTHGFRGEALASISHVAHLSIVTKTCEMPCAYRCSYSDGKLVGAAKPCAGTQGTQIIVEDLFYNVPTRKNALKSPADEYQRIIDVVTRFAVHNASVGFSLKKITDAANDVRTPTNSTSVDNIRLLYGNAVAKELVQLDVTDNVCKFKACGWISNLDFAGAKFTMLLFINNRSVESSLLKKALDSVYSTYLGKGKHPFVYLSLEIAPQNVDVNVHPTKHEVHFLHEEAIIHKIQSAADLLLKGASTSRSFTIQTIIPKSAAPLSETRTSTAGASATAAPATGRVYDKDLVRTDGRTQKIDKFFNVSSVADESTASLETSRCQPPAAPPLQKPVQPSAAVPEPAYSFSMVPTAVDSEPSARPPADSSASDLDESAPVETTPEPAVESRTASATAGKTYVRRNFELTSLVQLRAAVAERGDAVLRDTFRQSTFVGCVSARHALMQHQTKLYIVQMERVAEEFFYQLMLAEFGNFGFINLSGRPALNELARLAMDDPANEWRPEDGAKDELADQVRRVLAAKSEMLDDYFSLVVDQQAHLVSIPLLLVDYVPDLSEVPSLVLRLATDVNWKVEKECFESLCRVVARFYRRPDTEATAGAGDKDWKWTVEHVLYPAVKANLVPPKDWIDNGTILQIADLPDLYKVFERC